MSLSKTKLAILSLILANIIWGASFPIYKWTLHSISPFSFAFLRFFLGAILLLPFALKNLNIRKEDWLKVLGISIVSISIQIPLLLFGLRLTSSVDAPIIISAGPIFLIIASFFFLKDRAKNNVLAGTVISLVGVLLIILQPFFESGLSKGILGNFLIFLATLCGVYQIVMLKKIMDNNKAISVTFWTFILGSFFLFFPAYFLEPNLFNISSYNTQSVVGILFGVIFASVIAHFLLFWGVKFIKASEVGVFSYVDPIATIVIAVPLLGEKITGIYILGAVLVFFGIFVAEKRIHYHPIGKLFGE